MTYPYPFHVFVPSFVNVKLSGRDMYRSWETQMSCLLESHDMRGFIDGTLRPPDAKQEKSSDEDYKLWKRSDELVKGWILGSLSEQALRYVVNLRKKNESFTAKDVWDNVTTMYGPPPPPKYSEPITIDGEEKDAEKKEVDHSLLEATLKQDFSKITSIKKKKKLVEVEDTSTLDGNTVFHIAVSTSTNREFLKKMLNWAHELKPELDMKNSQGSTLLHVAAIVGDIDAAQILVEKNPNLLFAKDNEGKTPLVRALSNVNKQDFVYLLNEEVQRDREAAHTSFSASSGDDLLVEAISSKDYKLALSLIFLLEYSVNSDGALMALAQNFPSELRIWEKKIFKSLEGITRVGKSVWPFKHIYMKGEMDYMATTLLHELCRWIKWHQRHSAPVSHYYTKPIFEATRQNARKVVEAIVKYFPDAIWTVNEDGHSIIQYAVINRSEHVYNLVYQMKQHKNIYKTMRDSSGNNLLHLAARLAPANKLDLISGAPLQIQRELQWFKEVERFVCPLNIIQKNSLAETPEMVFTREHKDLVDEGEKWMKATAKSYTITATLITTIMFAAAITVPGGNKQDTGIPLFTGMVAFKIFAITDAISLFTSVTSVLMFLSILTGRFAEQDFLKTLPKKLMIGLLNLFISTTAMIIAYGATLFLMFGQNNLWNLIPIAALTCLPIASFVTLQLPLMEVFLRSTCGRSKFRRKTNKPFY